MIHDPGRWGAESVEMSAVSCAASCSATTMDLKPNYNYSHVR